MADSETLTTLTADIVASYVASNSVSANDVGALITSTYLALSQASNPGDAVEAAPEYVGAVTVKKSLANPDFIVSMIDGKPYKMLKRHLSGNGLTVEEYKARYNLPRDYPMTSATYGQARRDLAVKIGLGKGGQQAPAKPAPKPRAKPQPKS